MSTGFGPSSDPRQPGYDSAAYQPGYDSTAYQPGYSSVAYQPGAGTGRNPAGRVSLAAGIVLVVLGLVQQAVGYGLPVLMADSGLSSYDAYRTFTFVVGGLTLVIGLAAVIAGGVGLHGAGKPKAAAGAGFALGAWGILSTVVGFLLPWILAGVS